MERALAEGRARAVDALSKRYAHIDGARVMEQLETFDKRSADQLRAKILSQDASPAQWMAFLNARLVRQRRLLRALLDRYTSDLADALEHRVMRGASTLAAKLDDIAETTSGECYDDVANEVNTVYIPRRRLVAINRLRSSSPDVYARVRDYAMQFSGPTPEDKKKAAGSFFRFFVYGGGGVGVGQLYG